MKRHEIQILKRAGLGTRDAARQAEVSERTVERVAQEPPVTSVEATDADARARTGRPSKVAAYEDKILEWLGEEPAPSTVAILQRLREADPPYKAGKSAVYAAVKKLRPKAKKPGIVRFEGVAGEFSQHDFGTVWVRYVDGSRERLKFFASRLKYSRMVRVRITPNEKVESVCHSLADAFSYFEGQPLLAVFDNPKTIVVERDGKKITWNSTFAQFACECGFVPKACWPYRPNEKGSVENLVGFVKTSFFKVYRFADRADLDARLERWHEWANDERKCRATGETPRARFLLEQLRLRPVGLDSSGYRLKYSRKVRTDGFCEFGGLRYFAGLDHVGQVATLHVDETRVWIYVTHEQVAEHPREPVNGKYAIAASQRGELLTKPGARPYAKRQLLIDLCPAAEWTVTEIRHRRPNDWVEQVDQLYALLEAHGEDALKRAFARAARESAAGAEYVQAILDGQTAVEVQA